MTSKRNRQELIYCNSLHQEIYVFSPGNFPDSFFLMCIPNILRVHRVSVQRFLSVFGFRIPISEDSFLI